LDTAKVGDLVELFLHDVFLGIGEENLSIDRSRHAMKNADLAAGFYPADSANSTDSLLVLFGFGCIFGHGVKLDLLVLLVLIFSTGKMAASAACVKKFF
jgi:hypothetical protein